MGPVPFLGGADMSFLDELEAHGFAFRDRAGSPGDCLAIVRDLGWNVVRLRLWSAPRGGYGNLERMAALAARVRAAGLRLLLDLDYSDHWADPGKQTKPAAWRDLPFVELCAAVHDYTRLAVDACRPDIVQVGNEITPGMLWDDGRVGGPFDTEAQWDRFACLLAAGGTGVRAAAPEAAVMIHIDRGGDNRASRWFFDRLCVHPETSSASPSTRAGTARWTSSPPTWRTSGRATAGTWSWWRPDIRGRWRTPTGAATSSAARRSCTRGTPPPLRGRRPSCAPWWAWCRECRARAAGASCIGQAAT